MAARLPGRLNAGAPCPQPVSTLDLFPTLLEYCQLSPPGHKLDGLSLKPLLGNSRARWDRPAITTYGRGYFSARDERYRYPAYLDGTDELYDHRADPHKFRNLADSPDLKAVKQRPCTWVPAKRADPLGGR